MNNEHSLHEIITVIAIFKPGNQVCLPIKFRRANGREVVVSELGLRHPAPRGNQLIHIFDVTDGQSEYRLEFNARTLVWRLTREAVYEY